MRYILHVIIGLLVAYACHSSYDFYKYYQKVNEQQYDYAEINEIKYGLFNLDEWKARLFDILEKKAGSFELQDSDYQAIQKIIERYLYSLHKEYFESGKLVESLTQTDKEENKVGAMFLTMFKGNIQEQIEKFDFKSKVPMIAGELIKELKRISPEIKEALTAQISNMLAEEVGQKMQDRRQRIYNKYDMADYAQTDAFLEEKLAMIPDECKDFSRRILISLFIALLILLLGMKFISFRPNMLWLGVISTVFLVTGLALPMIDLDARLSSVDLQIMDETIHFDEQVMYFQSKSIIDVTNTLLESRGIDTKIVGILILVFSIILPLSKMLLSIVYLFIERAKRLKLVQAIIFYMGKWSMADVFVVAIFMSYIGFNGLINSQLIDMNQGSGSAVINTVNYSKLSPGIIFFTIYVVLSIIMSSLIHRNMPPAKV